MLGELEITNAVVLDEVQSFAPLRQLPVETKKVMLQIQYEETNGRTFLNGQVIVDMPTLIANEIQHNRPITNGDVREMMTASAIETLYTKLTVGAIEEDQGEEEAEEEVEEANRQTIDENVSYEVETVEVDDKDE